MKYSLKNRQFRKRNQIFGERAREELLPEDIRQDLEAIRESWEDSEQSQEVKVKPKSLSKEKLYQFINYNGNAEDRKVSPFKEKIKKPSSEHRNTRHGLSPINKPILNNPLIRLAESVRESRSCNIDSQTVSYCYFPQKQPDDSKETQEIISKLCTLFIKNNQRIDQMQKVIVQMVQRGHLMSKYLNQGVKTVINVEQQTSLLFNTMRSVYQNLRICNLKQENLELYFKQSKSEVVQMKSQKYLPKQHLKQHPKQHLKQHLKQHPHERMFNDLTVKYDKPRYSESPRYQEHDETENEKESRHLVQLIDYESDSSMNSIHQGENTFQSNPRPFSKLNHASQYQHFLDPIELENSHNPAERAGYEQLSPFEANRMISTPQHSGHQISHSPQFVRSPQPQTAYQPQFSTFKPQNALSNNSDEQNLKLWLQNTNQLGLKCWKDELGCLRRGNNTYIFSSRGEVVTVSPQSYRRFVEEGVLVPLSDDN